MGSPLAELSLSNPVIAAPMAGGATTPELVIAAARAGSLGLLAGGMRPPELLAGDIGKVRSETDTFGVNLFAPNPMPVDLNRFHDYASYIQTEADAYGVDLRTAEPVEDDDEFHDKVELLVSSPVPVVSFTFGVPDALTIQRLRRAGTVVVQTVTSAQEARHAEQAGADVLVVQSTSAGGHSGTLTPKHLPTAVPLTELIATIRHACHLPLIAAGGLSTSQEVAAVLANGAEAAMVGTLLLRTNESGTSPTHKAALGDPDRTETVVTRAFTGRPARALRNRFTDRYSAIAPLGYPALHHLSTPLRKAATAAGDPELMNLWAGTGFRNAVAEGAGQTLTRLAASL
jgi:nitronate monooxygenase